MRTKKIQKLKNEIELIGSMGVNTAQAQNALLSQLGKMKNVRGSEIVELTKAVQAATSVLKNIEAEFNRSETNDYINLFASEDLMICNEQFEYSGAIWNHEFKIEQMGYYRGQLLGVRHEDKLFMCPFSSAGGLSPDGSMTKFRLLPFNGSPVYSDNIYIDNEELNSLDNAYGKPVFQKGFEKLFEKIYDSTNSVIWFDQVPNVSGQNVRSRFSKNSIIMRDEAQTMSKQSINLTINNKKLILEVNDISTKNRIVKELETQFNNNSPFVVISTDQINKSNLLTSNDGLQAGELWHILKQYRSLRLIQNGIQTTPLGTDKGERLITGEISGADEVIKLVKENRLKMRKLFCSEVKKVLRLNITVTGRVWSSEKEDYINVE